MRINEQKQAIRAINETLADAESEYRLCAVCGKIIKEGYYYSNTDICCSDECGARYEGVSKNAFISERKNISDEDFERWQEGFWSTVG